MEKVGLDPHEGIKVEDLNLYDKQYNINEHK
jgi:hypothetical protein